MSMSTSTIISSSSSSSELETYLMPSLGVDCPTLRSQLREQPILVRSIRKFTTFIGVELNRCTCAAKVDELLVDNADEILAFREDDLALVDFAIVLSAVPYRVV